MPDAHALELETLKNELGFDPYALSESVYACGHMAHGPRAGYVCVFSTDTAANPAFFGIRNYADAHYGQAEGHDVRRGLVYLFRPVNQAQPANATRQAA